MGLGDTPHSFARTDTNLSVRKKRREPFRKEDCQAAMAGGLAVEGCHLHRPYHSVRGRHLRQCVEALKRYKAEDIPVAAVATGFPSGQMPLPTRLQEIKMAVADGAKEIDIVINRQLALEQRWTELYEEVKQ